MRLNHATLQDILPGMWQVFKASIKFRFHSVDNLIRDNATDLAVTRGEVVSLPRQHSCRINAAEGKSGPNTARLRKPFKARFMEISLRKMREQMRSREKSTLSSAKCSKWNSFRAL